MLSLSHKPSSNDSHLQMKKISSLQWSFTGEYKPLVRQASSSLADDQDKMIAMTSLAHNVLSDLFIGCYRSFCVYIMVSSFVFLWDKCVYKCVGLYVYLYVFLVYFL